MKRLAGRRQPDAATTLPERSRLPARSTVAFGIPFILTLYAQQVRGYSAVEFGLSSLPLPLGAVVGSLLGQAVVLRVGFRPVAAAGMALTGASALSRTDDVIAENGAGNMALALTEGFQSAFLACAVLAGIGTALALLLLGRPRGAPQEQLEPSPVPASD
jgi:hypothetical protein